MSARRWVTLGLVSVCALLSVSCITPCFLAGANRGSTPQPTALPTATPSEHAASSLEDKAQAFREGTFRVEFTDEEVTSYAALNMTGAAPIASPRVTFLPGEFTLEGDLTSPIRGHLTLTGTIQIAEGRPQVRFQNAQVAGVTVPQAMLGSVSDSISQMITESASGVEIERIELLAGRIVISGRSTSGP